MIIQIQLNRHHGGFSSHPNSSHEMAAVFKQQMSSAIVTRVRMAIQGK
jgi:hypothetical protein